MQTIDYATATRFGFPASPRPGQLVRDRSGKVWRWFGDDSGLADLGFWGAIIGAATGIVGAFKGSSDKKKQQEHERQMMELQLKQQEMQLQMIEAQKLKLGKREIFLIALGLMGLMFMTK
jgi:hypothetical protein